MALHLSDRHFHSRFHLCLCLCLWGGLRGGGEQHMGVLKGIGPADLRRDALELADIYPVYASYDHPSRFFTFLPEICFWLPFFGMSNFFFFETQPLPQVRGIRVSPPPWG
jgi:hypothetical protein